MHTPKIILGAAAGVAVLLSGCTTKAPPTTEEIRQQAGAAVSKLTPADAWKEGSAMTGPIQDNWLATFDDAQLTALVHEAIANNPDLRVSAVRVEQAAQYVEMAKAALRPAVNLLGTGGFKMGGGDVSSALQGLSVGAAWEPDLWGRMRY